MSWGTKGCLFTLLLVEECVAECVLLDPISGFLKEKVSRFTPVEHA